MKNRVFNPLHTIVWRALWWPIFMVGLIICFITLLVTMGLDRATEFWKHNV